ncbi:MAG: DASS family sodium-coupled anion symporter [Pirellulales bacterium]
MNDTLPPRDALARLHLPWDFVGLLLGPAALVAWLQWGSTATLTPEAHRLSAILILTIIWWITEPIPIAATGLCAVVLSVILGAVPVAEGTFDQAKIAFSQFGNPTLFFLLGGMFIGRAMTRHGLDRRMALAILAARWATRSSTSLLAAAGLTAMLLSMWISNTAATAMIYPVALGMISVLAGGMEGADAESFPRSRYASALLLMIAYATSAGGIATPIGTTTNVVAMGYFRTAEYFGRPIDFGRWSIVGVPMMVLLGLALFFWLRLLAPAEKLDLPALAAHLRAQRAKLGRWSAGERNTLAVFLLVVALWVAPSVLLLAGFEAESEWLRAHFPEEVVAMMAPVLLFLLPVDWRARRFSLEAEDFARIDWSTLLLFGSGLALGNLMFQTGLVRAIGQSAFDYLNTDDVWAITALAIGGGVLMSAFTSNAATAAALIPVVAAICRAGQVDEVMPLMGVTFAASFGSALPVSTPPNAIVYGSGLIPARRMFVAGLGFDVASGVVIWCVLRVAGWCGWTPLA